MPPTLNLKRFLLVAVGVGIITGSVLDMTLATIRDLFALPPSWLSGLPGGLLYGSISGALIGLLFVLVQRGHCRWLRSDPPPPRA